MKKFLPVIILVITLLPGLPIAYAAGIQVSPSKLDFTLTNGKASSQFITIVNPTADVQVYEVYADDFTDIIKANPESFTLESGARKVVEVKAAAPKDQGQLATNLSVVGKPLADNKFSVGTGVKIPLTISITGSAPKNNQQMIFWVLGSLLLIAIAIVLSFKIRKKAA